MITSEHKPFNNPPLSPVAPHEGDDHGPPRSTPQI
jgi:hypothetical protein